MTRNEEDQILKLKKGWKGNPNKRKVQTDAPGRDSRASVALGHRSLAQRLSYGFSLMALDESGVYGEKYE